jgi:hypothetical protein
MRNGKGSFWLGMLTGGGLVLAGLLLGAADEAAPEVVQSRRFEVVDEIGTVQLVLGTNREGGSLSVRDRLGRTVLLFATNDEGGTMVMTHPALERPGAIVRSTANGGSVQLNGRDGQPIVVTGTTAGDALSIGDGRGGHAHVLGAASDGAAAWTAHGGEGARIASLSADAAGGGVFETYQQGRPLITLSSTVGGHGQIRTLGLDGETLTMLTATAENEGQFYTFGSNGAPLVALASRPAGPTARIYNQNGEPAVTIETDEEGRGVIGLWSADGTGRVLKP